MQFILRHKLNALTDGDDCLKSATLDSWFAPMEPMPSDSPKPEGGSEPQLDNLAKEAERVLDELTASIPETLASQAASFRESAREIDQRRARASESSETPVSGELEWAKEIAAFMRGMEFRKIRDSFHGWARHDGIVVMDAKSDNFILTDKGIVPIDLQIGVNKPSEFPGLDFA